MRFSERLASRPTVAVHNVLSVKREGHGRIAEPPLSEPHALRHDRHAKDERALLSLTRLAPSIN